MPEQKQIILINNVFNGNYIMENVGGEIINMYQSDNGRFYIYVSPYGNINSKWDNQIRHIILTRSVGNGTVKIIGKAEIKVQICIAAKKRINTTIHPNQKKFISENDIRYGGVELDKLGSWSSYYVTFEAEAIYKAKSDLYLTTNNSMKDLSHTYIEGIGRINNQSQKLYIEPSNKNYSSIKKIINNNQNWFQDPVTKFIQKTEPDSNLSLLSIVQKENDELVNSNLLAYFIENDSYFWSDFSKEVLKIDDVEVRNNQPKVTRESIGNIDLFIEVGTSFIVIENKIKSGISAVKKNGYSQLEKYVSVAQKHIKELKIQHSQKKEPKLFFYLLRPDYNNEDFSTFNLGELYKEIKYSAIHRILVSRKSGYIFDEFKKVVAKHSVEYDNELFELMDKRFAEQISIANSIDSK